MKNMREELDIITAYNMVGTYRGAADICGTTHKTVKRVVLRHAAGQGRPAKAPRPANYEDVRGLVAAGVDTAKARISAKRLLPTARAAGRIAGGRLQPRRRHRRPRRSPGGQRRRNRGAGERIAGWRTVAGFPRSGRQCAQPAPTGGGATQALNQVTVHRIAATSTAAMRITLMATGDIADACVKRC